MQNLLKAIKDLLQSYTDDEPKPMLHVAEVTSLWSHLSVVTDEQVHSEAGMNSTTNPELKEAFQEAAKIFKSQKERLSKFMLSEGIPLPVLSESKPISDPNMIPMGVKLTDRELANSLNIKMVLGISFCISAIAGSDRNDVILMWAEFLQEFMIFGASLRALVKIHGWIKIPPYYYPPGLKIEDN